MEQELKVGVEVEKDENGWFSKESLCKTVKCVMDKDSQVGCFVKENHRKLKEVLSSPGFMNNYIDNFIQNLFGKLTVMPISLSKAASVMSNFVPGEAAGAGHSHAIATYLNRASRSFYELDEFHREIKRRRSQTAASSPMWPPAPEKSWKRVNRSIEQRIEASVICGIGA
ncbi:UDP-glycosyltransferase [Datura stramonium]|uniref:UDP-glycosyltransferase n=1 Tax=Datura stramonium TaxID=4076 RepID=A0ABS8SYB5_DATST|nr:UDP-glycosyltransferase [Datura stramonium]